MPLSANIVRLYLIRFLFWMNFFSAVIVPFYRQWGGLELSQILFLNAWFMFCIFLFEMPTGTLADYLGRKASLITGSLVAVLSVWIYTREPNFYLFMLAELVFAAAYTFHSGADEALAYDTLLSCNEEGQAKSVIARMESFKLAGIMAGALSGGWIANHWGVVAPMKAYALPLGLSFLAALTLKEPALHKNLQTKPPFFTIFKEGKDFFMHHKILWILTLDSIFSHALVWVLIWLYQPLLEKAGVSIVFFGFVHTGMCLGQIFLLHNIQKWENLLRSKKSLLWLTSLGTGLAFIILAFAKTPWLVIFAIVLAGSCGLSRTPIYSASMNAYIPSAQRATVLSMISMLRTLTIVVVNPCVGFLADVSLSMTMLVLGTALLGLTVFSRVEERHLKG
jgi:MFS family permease